MLKKLLLLVVAVVLSLPLLVKADEATLRRDIILLRQSKTDMVRYTNHSTAVQIKLNMKLDKTRFGIYSSHRQAEIAALQARPVTSGVNTGDVTIGTANGLSLSGQALSLQAATDSVPGALTAADHASFAAKQNALTAGVDYLTPTGSAAGLTGFPTLNQNTTGSAAKLTTARTINGVAFDGSANIQTATANTSDYSLYTAASTACTGAITTAVVWKITQVAGVVTLTLPATTGTATAVAYFRYGVQVPAQYRPAATLAFPVLVMDNGANSTTPGMMIVNAVNGNITVYRDASTVTNFTNAANAGLGNSVGTVVSWTTN